ncbi:MAG: type II toxin-antitoxin system Phd/YefM family antitoxin [Gammaproteobacteria bacterium]|nr:type II toxin-antitoxin system Phd/YefM family antitoxin [Gammaproteobacteria bacterium]
MIETINIHYAKTHFSKLITRVESGEEIIIAKSGKPVARLVPLDYREDRVPGIAEGRLTDAFFEPLPAEELDFWE